MEQLNCPECKSKDWIAVNGQMINQINHEKYGQIAFEKRKCVDCNTIFDVGIDAGENEFYL